MFKILFLLTGVALVQGAKIGPYLNVFSTLNDNILMADKTFFGEENYKLCKEFQIFCDWLFKDYEKERSIVDNFKQGPLEILKNPKYMVFIKNPIIMDIPTRGKRRCSGFISVCENLEDLRIQNEIDQDLETSTLKI